MAEEDPRERPPGKFEIIVLSQPLRDFPVAIPGGCNASNSGCSCNDGAIEGELAEEVGTREGSEP